MARRTKVFVDEIEYDLQSVPNGEYMAINDRYGITSNKTPNHTAYFDWLLRSCVVSPKEVAMRGVKYFEEDDDNIGGLYDLVREIETFLGERRKSRRSVQSSEG
jgi:hypothetical protein